MPKRGRGVPICVTVSPYINKQLERLIERTQLTKSAIFTVAVEKYAREMDKVQGKDLVRQEALF